MSLFLHYSRQYFYITLDMEFWEQKFSKVNPLVPWHLAFSVAAEDARLFSSRHGSAVFPLLGTLNVPSLPLFLGLCLYVIVIGSPQYGVLKSFLFFYCPCYLCPFFWELIMVKPWLSIYFSFFSYSLLFRFVACLGRFILFWLPAYLLNIFGTLILF